MRLLLLTTTILALLASLVLAADTVVCRSSNRNGENNREIVQAINAFCGWTWDLVRSFFFCFSVLFSSLTTSHFPWHSWFPTPSPSPPLQSIHSLSRQFPLANGLLTRQQTVPSVKAKLGAYSKNGRIRVNINGGTCAKTSWVPRKYCISQFYRVCAVSVKAGRGGNGVLGFGPGGCQKFTISNA